MKVDVLDLFSGCGGFSLGLKRAGFEIGNHYFSEVDKYAIANYKHNFKDAEYVGAVQDVRGIKADIITFGSPCQDFSLAGKRKGMDGSRSSLIMEAIRVISETRPSVFIWENVKGTLSSNGGADFWAILAAFANIGDYRLEWQLLNTSWVLPQNRERIYLVGHLADRSESGVFPIGGVMGKTDGPRRQRVTQINPSKESGGKQPYQQNRVYDSNGLMPALTSLEKNNIKVEPVLKPDRLEKRQNGRRFKEDGEPAHTLTSQDRHGVMITSNTSKGVEEVKEGDSINFTQPNSKTRRGRVGKGKAQKLDTHSNQGVLEGTQIRRLTEIECERLQGFPDGWTKYGNFDGETKEISRTQRYKMLGNAVTVDVVAMVASRLKIIPNMQLTIDDAIKARDNGIKKALDHANEKTLDWSNIAFKYLKGYIKEHSQFMTEDVRTASSGIVPEPPSARAWGGVIRRAAKAGIIKKLGHSQVKNPKAHRAFAAVWGVIV